MINKSSYKDISFFSGFSYLRQVAHFATASHSNGSSQVVDGTVISLPASVISRPPLVEYYLESPAGSMRKLEDGDGIEVGADSNNIYLNGGWNNGPTYTTSFTIHSIVYDRSVT